MPFFVAVYPRAGKTVSMDCRFSPTGGGCGPARWGVHHSAIILGIPEAETLYNWAEVGVVVVIE